MNPVCAAVAIVAVLVAAVLWAGDLAGDAPPREWWQVRDDDPDHLLQ